MKHGFVPESHDPLHLLQLFSGLEATDKKDSVYGLLGLLHIPLIDVDYNKTVAQVYADVILAAIRAQNDLRALSYVHHGSVYDPNDGFPSWVRRWDTKYGFSKFWSSKLPPQGFKEPALHLSPECQGILQLRGYLIDAVDSTAHMNNSLPHSVLMKESEPCRPVILSLLREAYNVKRRAPHLHSLSLSTLAATLTVGSFTGEASSFFGRIAEAFFRRVFPDESFLDKLSQDKPSQNTAPEWIEYAHRVYLGSWNRRFFTTSGGYIGLGPTCMRSGDQIVLLDGGVTPYAVRPVGKDTHEFYFMGGCYVHQLMWKTPENVLGPDIGESRAFFFK